MAKLKYRYHKFMENVHFRLFTLHLKRKTRHGAKVNKHLNAWIAIEIEMERASK